MLRWIDRSPQDLIDRFFALCRTGRIGLTALRWHTTALADAASLRRLLDGKRRLEAVSGLPIQVACQFDVTGVPWRLADELIDHGVTGFLVDSVDAAVDAIDRVGEIDRAACRAAASARFTVDRMADRYLDLYRSLLG